MNLLSSSINPLLAVLCLAALAACDHFATRQEPQPGGASLTIMTFNVENLFDNLDDPGKEDRTYLALADKQNREHRAACNEIEVDRWRAQCLEWDWNDAVIEKKLRILANVILQVGNGRGPDIIALQEVENLDILERLRTEYLAAGRVRPGILRQGADHRGVGFAIQNPLEQSEAPPQQSKDF